MVCHVLAKQGGNTLCWSAFFQPTVIHFQGYLSPSEDNRPQQRLVSKYHFVSWTDKYENHRESLEQILRWDELRCICQLYGQMTIWISLLNRSLLYDSEDRSAWCKLSEGRRLCICQRLSWCCPGALRHTVQQLLQGCAAVHGHFLSQSTKVLPGIPAV